MNIFDMATLFGGNPAQGLNPGTFRQPGLRMPTAPSTTPGMANLQAPANAFMPTSGMDNMQMANLAMSLMGGAQQEAPPPPPVLMMDMAPATLGQDTQQFMQMYGPQATMQQDNDEMMRQRMQGLMALLGG
jgi:hypothetical protein